MNDDFRPTDHPLERGPAAPATVISPLAEFSHWLDSELALLEARWAHAAAPSAHSSTDTWGRSRGANKL